VHVISTVPEKAEASDIDTSLLLVYVIGFEPLLPDPTALEQV
jgi:hypothetical protein